MVSECRSRPGVRWRLPSAQNPFKKHRFWAPRTIIWMIIWMIAWMIIWTTRVRISLAFALRTGFRNFCKMSKKLSYYGVVDNPSSPERLFSHFFGKVFGPARVRISLAFALRSGFVATSKKCAPVWAHKGANMLHGRRPHASGFHWGELRNTRKS